MAIDRSPAPSNQTVMEAANQIDALLADDPEFAAPADDEKVSRRTEQLNDAKVEEQPAEESPAEEVEAKEEDQPAEESESLEIDPDEAIFEVEESLADGSKETKKYSLNELRQQRMLQSDYTRKTQELAKQRAEIQEQLQKGVEQQRNEYVQALDAQQQAFMELLAPEVQNLDQLAETDPAEYVRVQNRINKFDTAIKQIEARKQEAIQQHQEHVRTNILPKEMELLKSKIPDWSDASKQVIIETGKQFGLTEQELGSVIDHRQVHILHELHRLQNLEKSLNDKKVIAAKKVVEKPKIVKSGGPQKQRSEAEESLSKVKKTGRWQDAVGAIHAQLHDL